MINIDFQEIDDFVVEQNEVIKVEVKKDFNRRTKLALLLSKFEIVFEVSDAETLNKIIKI